MSTIIISHPGPVRSGKPGIARRTAMIAARPPHPRREHPGTSRTGGVMRAGPVTDSGRLICTISCPPDPCREPGRPVPPARCEDAHRCTGYHRYVATWVRLLWSELPDEHAARPSGFTGASPSASVSAVPPAARSRAAPPPR